MFSGGIERQHRPVMGYAKPLKNEREGFYTLLSLQDNIDALAYFPLFKQIVPASLNIPSLKATDKVNLIYFSY